MNDQYGVCNLFTSDVQLNIAEQQPDLIKHATQQQIIRWSGMDYMEIDYMCESPS